MNNGNEQKPKPNPASTRLSFGSGMRRENRNLWLELNYLGLRTRQAGNATVENVEKVGRDSRKKVKFGLLLGSIKCGKSMAKYKPYNFDQLVMIPISLENLLQPGTLEYTIHVLVENKLDLSVFEERYQNDDTGATAINPKTLLNLILFAYSRGTLSS